MMNASCDATNAGCGMDWVKQKSLMDAGAEVAAKTGKVEKLKAESLRMMELEMENFRLNKLVAELLLKNQQLRRAE
jgi:hypothetical protein